MGKSITFIVDKPVKREIFAGDFRDRVVHHLIINKLNHLFEKDFIFDSYACRRGRGTHFGIARIDRFIRQCSQNYTKDCYILKLDIQGFFMGINKNILHQKVWFYLWKSYLESGSTQEEFEIFEDLIRKVIFNIPSQNCTKNSSPKKWKGLPKSKSLFNSPNNKGLPIGNLTSQVFANVYLTEFDNYIKHTNKIRRLSKPG